MENLAALQPVLMLVTLDTILGLVAILVGGVALVIGIYHISEIHLVLKSTKTLLEGTKTQLEKLESLETMKGSISTHYISEFPDFIREIVALIQEARSSVLIFCDIPAYGQFSARPDWIQYNRAIEDLKENENVTIELVCLDHKRRVSFYHEFLQGLPWPKWKEKNAKKLEQLLLAKNTMVKFESVSEEEFVGLLEDTNKLMIQGAFSRIKPIEIKAFMPAYFWLVDGTHAIFSVPALHEGHTEYGFSTTDGKLIDAFREMRARYMKHQSDQNPAGL